MRLVHLFNVLALFSMALAKAVKLLGKRGLLADRAKGQIEATASSLLYGFKDDVVIRIQALDDGTKIDVGSRSRVGKIDRGANRGANVRRIRDFLQTFNYIQDWASN